jgi:peptidoglycan/xylan/chitin deacetylase (PgdA/CDA1 family)
MKAEPGFYDYWPYENRPKIEWPNGARVAFWVAPNIEFYELDPPANPHRQAWPQPYPALPGYSIRDYGNRVGHVRQMEVLDRYGVRGSISLSTALCDHHPEIIAMCAERDWESFSHGIYNTRYTYGMSEQQERDMIRDSMESIQRHSGQHCAGYLAPALSHSELTLDLFAEVGSELAGDEAGFYTCDLFHDDLVNKIEPRRYGQILRDNFDRLYQEGARSGTVMCIPTHNYQVSCPHRLRAFEEALEYITGHSDVWVTTGAEIARHFIDNCYQQSLADINARSGGH